MFEEEDGATPLTLSERQDLIPTYIALRQELNEAEQRGILRAEQWAFSRKRPVLQAQFLKKLHYEMFKDVWKWAGRYRITPRNIGIEPWRLVQEVGVLLDDVRYWITHQTYMPDEIALRFHHRLVGIHPFPNGNGRHGRLAADLLIVQLDQERFTWGYTQLTSPSVTRQHYIQTLRKADQGDIVPLLAFARYEKG